MIYLKQLKSIIKKILKFFGLLDVSKNLFHSFLLLVFKFKFKKRKLTINRKYLFFDNCTNKKYFILNTSQKKFALTKKESIQRKTIFKNLKNVFISGKFGSIYDDDFFYINNDYDYKNILLPEEMHLFIKIYENNKKLYLYEPRFIKKIKINHAISFLSLQSHNYAHWVLETLPNLLFSLNNIKKDTKILINYGLHENHIQSLKILLGNKFRNVFFVKTNQIILARNLVYYSPLTHIPFHPKNNITKYDHGFANDSILSNLKSHYAKNYHKKTVKLRKVFLARKNTSRNILNYEEVLNLVKSFKYEFIFCDDFDFLDQVNIFSNVTHVIAPSGASCANLLFCKPRTNVLIFFNSHPNMIFKLWKIFFKSLNISFIKCKSKNLFDFHSDYYVDCNKLRKFLIEFNS